MPVLQFIEYRGQPVAVVLGPWRAAVSSDVVETDLSVVQAMCVYALEIAAGERPGPYEDAEAEDYARILLRGRESRGARPCPGGGPRAPHH